MADHKVDVYSTPTCPWCHKAKDWMKEHNVDFKDHNVAEDEAARDKMIEQSGQRGVPVITIDGEVIVGFDVDRFKELLDIKE